MGQKELRIQEIKKEITEIALSNMIGVRLDGDAKRVKELEAELKELEEQNG